MPGLSLYCSFNRINETDQNKLLYATKIMEINKRFETIDLYQNPYIIVKFTGYSQYPRTIIDTDDYLIFIEGCIYNKSDDSIQDDLKKFAKQFFSTARTYDYTEMTRWLLSCDGEFIVLIISKSTSEIVLFNDSLGRLPLYYKTTDDYLFISREPKLIISTLNLKTVDKMGIAECLIFGFNLGGRTMIKDIMRFQPASFVRFSRREKRLEIKVLYQWDFTDRADPDVNFDKCASELESSLVTATRNRVEKLSELYPVLALSGGLDSRVIMLALNESQIKYSAYTSLNPERTNRVDVEVSRDLVNLIPCDWRVYQHKPISIDDYKQIAYNQESGSSVYMVVALDGYRQVQQEFGHDIALFTGDLGGNVMNELSADAQLTTMRNIYHTITNIFRIFKVEDACSLLGINQSDFFETFSSVFNDFPETDFNWKYAHFIMLGRGFRFTMEGEDRSRFFFWLQAPFWGTDVLRSMINIPDKLKKHQALFIHYFKSLDKDALKIKYANTGLLIDSKRAFIFRQLRSFAKKHMWVFHQAKKAHLTSLYQRYKSKILDPYLHEIVKSSSIIEDNLDLKIYQILNDKGLNRLQYNLLATVILRLHLLENDFNFKEPK